MWSMLWLATQCLPAQNAMLCSNSRPSFTGCDFSLSFCRNTCLFPYHWWGTIYRQAKSAEPLQRSSERNKNAVCCCAIHHEHQLPKPLGDGQMLSTPAMALFDSNLNENFLFTWRFVFVLQLTDEISRENWNPISHTVSRESVVCKSLLLLRAYISAAFCRPFLTNSPSQYSFDVMHIL